MKTETLEETEEIIKQTESWIKNVVVGCNFCPFASKALTTKSIRYIVMSVANFSIITNKLRYELTYLHQNASLETTIIIFANDFKNFNQYLDVVEIGNLLLKKDKWEGVFQLASFHPSYLFAGSKETDASNYTNRSPYPMLHILREESITKALKNFADYRQISSNNIKFTQEKGLQYMQVLLTNCEKV